jgi:hypothetical protein
MTPNYDQWLSTVWGWPIEEIGPLSLLGQASNVVIGVNPPYSIALFSTIYPQFIGAPTPVTGNTNGTDGTLANVAAIGTAAEGQLIIGPNIGQNSVITDISGTGPYTFTLSQKTTAAGAVAANYYAAPLVPLPVINAYVYLAHTSLPQARWCDGWLNGMALFIAHYLTLWLRASNGVTTGAQAASRGLALGILTSKSADGVSAGYTALTGNEEWGAWNLTLFGQLFATQAKVVGTGPMLLH